MKKIISLFVSMLLIFSMTCSVALADWTRIPDETVLIDTANAGDVTIKTENYRTYGYISENGVENTSIRLNLAGKSPSVDSGGVITIDASVSPSINFYPNCVERVANDGSNAGTISEGIYEISMMVKASTKLSTNAWYVNNDDAKLITNGGWIETEWRKLVTTLYLDGEGTRVETHVYDDNGDCVHASSGRDCKVAEIVDENIQYVLATFKDNSTGTIYIKDIKAVIKADLSSKVNISGTVVSGTAAISNQGETADYIAYLASYDAEGKLIGIKSDEMELYNGDKYKVELTDTQGAASAKMFVWKGLEPVAYAASN